MKIPPHEFSSTVESHRDIIGLPLVEEEAPNIVFEFGEKRLWLGEVKNISQAEIWLEIQSPDGEAVAVWLVATRLNSSLTTSRASGLLIQRT
jgi:hypothetical protein